MDNKITEAIILAGGLGTRIRSAIGEMPKCMAPINNQPFLNFVLRYLIKNGIQRVIISVGYKADEITNYYNNSFEGLVIEYAIESEPMGTGGALKLALEKAHSEILFVLNGDTIFDIPLNDLAQVHIDLKAVCTIALKRMFKVDRYGAVKTDESGKVLGFAEKKYADEVVINGGVYVINKSILVHYPVNTPFSFEINYLQNNPKAKNIHSKLFDSYFCDIGIPEDYDKFIQDNQV